MSIEINNESGVAVDEAALVRLSAFALDFLHVHPDADLAIARTLRTHVEASTTRAVAIDELDQACAVLHNDIRIYRQRLLAEIAAGRIPTRRLHAVPESAALAASRVDLRVPEVS